MDSLKAQLVNLGRMSATTPQSVTRPIAVKRAPAAPTMTPPRPRVQSSGTNAQTQAMQNAINKTYKVQKTFGVPGAR